MRLQALQYDAQTLAAQTSAERAASQQLSLARQQYQLGANGYLDLLDAERSYQQARINLIRARASRLSDTAALYTALGGGWRSDCHAGTRHDARRFFFHRIQPRSSRMTTRSDKKPSTTKRMIWTIVAVLVLIAVIVGIKVLLVMRMIHSMPKPAPSVVSTTTATRTALAAALTPSARCARPTAPTWPWMSPAWSPAVNLKSGEDVKQGPAAAAAARWR